MSNDSSVDNRHSCRVRAEIPVCFQSDLSNSVQHSEEGRVIEENKWSVCARQSGQAASNAGNCFNGLGSCGFVGHDGVPWLWEAEQECWLPATKSSRAKAYAALQSSRPLAAADVEERSPGICKTQQGSDR
jgi:hypothetical protein